MANLTITVDDDLLRQARIRALAQGTSVDAAIRAFLEAFADVDPRRAAMSRFVEAASAAGAGSGGARWTRGDLHDRAALR